MDSRVKAFEIANQVIIDMHVIIVCFFQVLIKMIVHRILKEENKCGEYSIFESLDFEFVNPVEYYSTSFIETNFTMMKRLILLEKPPIPIEIIEKTVMKEAVKDWEKKLEKILNTEFPKAFISILSAQSKKEQVRLLKEQSITPEELLAFIFKASMDYGFTISQYRAEYNHKGLDESKMPAFLRIEDNKVFKIGQTSFSDGQLKQAVENRKVTISKFLDNGSDWHCFILTYDSLRGKDSWKDGQPHYHYISNKFGIPREKVVEELKSRKYKLNNLPHIDLIDYRNLKA